MRSTSQESRLLETTVTIEDPACRAALYGPADRHLRLIRSTFAVRLTAREGQVHLSGAAEAVTQAAEAIELLQSRLRTVSHIDDDIVHEAIRRARGGNDGQSAEALSVYLQGAGVVAKTDGQRQYVGAVQQNDLTVCVGPAGTGKTYLAVAMAVSLLKTEKIRSMVLVRPAVEAGEKLGYLPGDMQAKVNPYLRPLFDAMHDMMPFEQVKKYIQNDIIEVIPLAFMRGRTLNNAVIILDEAQNTTVRQMLMFLTRLGHGSKMIVTGDDTQIDLPVGRTSGVIDAIHRLGGVEGVAIVRLTEVDIVRHPLVKRVVDAYGANETWSDTEKSDEESG